MLLSLTTKVALTVMAPGMLEALTSVATRFIPLVTGRERLLVKHTITKRSPSTWITAVALHPVVFGLSYLYFPKGGTTAKMIE
jgi:uncharacterized protein YhhL (DUF1145 family)